MEADDAQKLDNFLSQVDQIESIVKGLATSDSKESLEKADEYLKKVGCHPDQMKKKYPPRDNTGVNRTVINQAAFKDDPKPPSDGSTDQRAFMSFLEKDAKERGERRIKQRQEATLIKEEGNKYFKEGDYHKAIELYTEALGVVKDLTALWTNRAQSYIKIGEYEKALSDCEWATRVHENCLKAYIHRGRAYLELGKYDEAVEAYNRALTIEPGKERVIKDYIAEVERRRTAAAQESAAQAFLSEGNMEAEGLVEVMKRIYKEGQVTMFYSGGLRLLEKTLKDNKERTLFRTEGGMEMITSHSYISKCWVASPRSVSAEELDLLSCMLDTYTAAVTDNEENVKRLMCLPDLGECLLRWAESSHKPAALVRSSVISLLLTVSTTEYGQKLVLENIDTSRLLNAIFTMSKSKGIKATNAMALLNNLALHKKFKSLIRPNVEELILPSFEALVTDESRSRLLPNSVTTLTNLCTDVHIRDKVSARPSLWAACLSVLDRHSGSMSSEGPSVEAVHAILGLVMNLSVELSKRPTVQEALTDSTSRLSCVCVRLGSSSEQQVAERAVAVLSHLLPAGGAAVEAACEAGAIALLVSNIKSENLILRKAGMKALAGCTQSSSKAKEELLKVHKGLSAVVAILKEEDEAMVGNSALCLSHVTSEEKVAGKLTKTNIIQHLLVKARDGRNSQLQHNCSILIAKLAQADQKHLEKLRELHGVEILVDVMKHIKT